MSVDSTPIAPGLASGQGDGTWVAFTPDALTVANDEIYKGSPSLQNNSVLKADHDAVAGDLKAMQNDITHLNYNEKEAKALDTFTKDLAAVEKGGSISEADAKRLLSEAKAAGITLPEEAKAALDKIAGGGTSTLPVKTLFADLDAAAGARKTELEDSSAKYAADYTTRMGRIVGEEQKFDQDVKTAVKAGADSPAGGTGSTGAAGQALMNYYQGGSAGADSAAVDAFLAFANAQNEVINHLSQELQQQAAHSQEISKLQGAIASGIQSDGSLTLTADQIAQINKDLPGNTFGYTAGQSLSTDQVHALTTAIDSAATGSGQIAQELQIQLQNALASQQTTYESATKIINDIKSEDKTIDGNF